MLNGARCLFFFFFSSLALLFIYPAGTHGSLALVREHPEWFLGKAATCLTEAGAITAWMGGKPHYMLQVAEKGFAWLKLKIRGRPGHGSTPHGEDALSLMAPLLSSIVEKPFFEHSVYEKKTKKLRHYIWTICTCFSALCQSTRHPCGVRPK